MLCTIVSPLFDTENYKNNSNNKKSDLRPSETSGWSSWEMLIWVHRGSLIRGHQAQSLYNEVNIWSDGGCGEEVAIF